MVNLLPLVENVVPLATLTLVSETVPPEPAVIVTV